METLNPWAEVVPQDAEDTKSVDSEQSFHSTEEKERDDTKAESKEFAKQSSEGNKAKVPEKEQDALDKAVNSELEHFIVAGKRGNARSGQEQHHLSLADMTATAGEALFDANDDSPKEENVAVITLERRHSEDSELSLPEFIPPTESDLVHEEEVEVHDMQGSDHMEEPAEHKANGYAANTTREYAQPLSFSSLSANGDGFSSVGSMNANSIDIKNIPPNIKTAREQEEADAYIVEGMNDFFNNRFHQAKAVFEKEAKNDPLPALCLGFMVFVKAILTYHEKDVTLAMDMLESALSHASAQIQAATPKQSITEKVSDYVQNIGAYFTPSTAAGLPQSPPPLTDTQRRLERRAFLSNGILRAHIIKAECSMLLGMLQYSSDTINGYLKCGFNLRRAYNSYAYVWKEYKRMGQSYHEYIDADTVSGIQFGIGAIHLLLSLMPLNVSSLASAIGWKADRQLGLALLKLCLESRRVRSPLASMALLAYYTHLTLAAPQILASTFTEPAIETLLDAQEHYENSAFFLYFAGSTSRIAKNIELSTQSYLFSSEIAEQEWASIEIRQANDYQIAQNCTISLNWQTAATMFDTLATDGYWSTPFCKYQSAACLAMQGRTSEAILMFAEVKTMLEEKETSWYNVERYVSRKLEFFHQKGYKDMDIIAPALELLCIDNAYEFMSGAELETCLKVVDEKLNAILLREKSEYEVRLHEIQPQVPTPDYFNQRAVLLLIKSAILNALHQYQQSIINLNWIFDHRAHINNDKWVVPFALWQAGVTTWCLDKKQKARQLWESAQRFSNYDFEFRLAVRLNLAILSCNEKGVKKIPLVRDSGGLSTHGKKFMYVMPKPPSVV
ncbi:hypothetical protein BZG36_02815 [Bifiguratus adelaidae]|uniref:Tetratricopeptide repeat protein 39C n=1 Tax=Bifiguratus adelaidae TaxID=1938954 RepID=A0A261Y1J5_9FUNG|nr:hypothetical protein BZG36_02815 [Bifiguratus adelaidae]